MRKLLLSLLILATSAIWFVALNKKKPIQIETDPVPVQYIGKVNIKTVSIRLLVLKHCFERMADGDANLAIEAANLAATKGLDIEDIGNFYINENGRVNRNVMWQKCSLEKLKDFVSSQMKVKAQPGDTLVIMTIGHGSESGYLDMLGRRSEVMKAIAEAAEENNQETLWWQLSCYASAYLPKINEISQKQQDVFSIVASSDASTPSPADLEGRIMKKLFVGMAETPELVDTDLNSVITSQELSNYLNIIERNRGSLVYAKSPSEPIFGLNLAWRIPIVDKNNPQNNYPKDYIPIPSR